MYAAVSDGLGNATITGLDTTTASYTYLRNAINAGLRAVETDIPFTVKDTITLAYNTFHYTLNANLVRPVDGELSGYRVELKSGDRLIGLREGTIEDFGVMVLTQVVGYRVEGNELIVVSWNPQGATLYVYGEGEITPITGGGSLITYPPDTRDRWAVVYYATAKLAGEQGDESRHSEYRQKYLDHVMKRTGQAAVTGGP